LEANMPYQDMIIEAAGAALERMPDRSRIGRFSVRVRSGLRHVRATIDGRRARVSRRGRRRVVVVRPRAGRRVAVVRISGVDRHGRKVVVRKRYRLCRG